MKTVEELAREAWFEPVLWDGGGTLLYEAGPLHISRFRDLVLEEAAKVCDANARKNSGLADKADEETDYEEKPYYQGAQIGSSDCADAIRAMKGQK